MTARPIFTYQTRFYAASDEFVLLDAYAELHGRAERTLFAAMMAGGQMNSLKQSFQTRFEITARQFNALRVGLEGKIKSIKERRPELIAEGESRIKKAGRVIAKLEKRDSVSAKLHQKKRRVQTLRTR